MKFVIFYFRGSTLNCWQWIFSWIATILYIISLSISWGSRLNFIYFITSVPYMGPRVFFLVSIRLLIKSGWAYWPERKNHRKFWKSVKYTQFRENIGQLYSFEKQLLKNGKFERDTCHVRYNPSCPQTTKNKHKFLHLTTFQHHTISKCHQYSSIQCTQIIWPLSTFI